MSSFFVAAKPVWAKGRELEKNLMCGFRTVFHWDGKYEVIFRVTASSVYRFFVNGEFIGAGPARGPHGFYRVDEWSLKSCAAGGMNVLAVEVAGYNINSFSWIDQPSFLQAEITCGGRVLGATGTSGGSGVNGTSGFSGSFTAGIVREHVQKVQRYSFQRPFAESWQMTSGFDAWRRDPEIELPFVETCQTKNKALITRSLPAFTFPVWEARSVVEMGTALRRAVPKDTCMDFTLKNIGEKLKGYKESELEVYLTDEALAIETHRCCAGGSLPLSLEKNSYSLFDFGIDKTGFIGLDISCSEAAEIYLMFDEILTDGDVDFTRMDCCNVIKYQLDAGRYSLLSFEPYTMKYLKIAVLGSASTIYKAFLSENICPVSIDASYEGGNDNLRKIFNAAVETFRQNCTDIYMDCPSRERAGWLCDSFFTSRVEYALTGASRVERNFLENFLLPEKFEFLPDGMLPMCYPSDHNDEKFIPNWALWFVVELEEYLVRSGDKTLVDAFKAKVYRLFDYFRPFLNEYGLLEKLEGWVFVEWSKANDLVQDVNFPTNMLYAGALGAAGRLYGDEAMLKQASEIRKTIREKSFDGTFFVDNAVRKGKELILSGERTETCQYYAFFFNIATPPSHEKLWGILTEIFGPQRKKTGAFPEIYPSNAFIGNYLRLDILLENGLREKLLKEIDGYFSYMAEKTGTLWENDTDYASCNHGFASYAAYLLLRV